VGGLGEQDLHVLHQVIAILRQKAVHVIRHRPRVMVHHELITRPPRVLPETRALALVLLLELGGGRGGGQKGV
jgi:hypothetical protein